MSYKDGFVDCKHCAEKFNKEDVPKSGKCPSCKRQMDGLKEELKVKKKIEETVVITKEEENLIYNIDRLIKRALDAERAPNRGRIIEMIGRFLHKKERFRTPNDIQILFRYKPKEGIYSGDGDVWVQGEVQRFMDRTTTPGLCSSHMGNEVVAMIKRLTFIEREKLEPPARYTPLANGIYDFEKETLTAFTPELFFTAKLAVAFDPEANCPKIDKFISEVVEPNEVKGLYELAGYVIRRENPMQKAWLFDGIGNNGKSVFIWVLEFMVGKENACSIPIQKLESNRFATAELEGKYLCSVADLSGADLKSTGMFKAIVGGDLIQAERKGQNPFRFHPWTKLVYSCNKIPDSGEDESNAFYRRWILTPFPYDFSGREDRLLKHTLIAPEELSGLLNKSLEAVKGVYERNKFSSEKPIEELRKIYVSKSNSAKAFVAFVKNDPEAFVPKSQVWKAYFEFCRAKHLTVKSERAFWQELKPIFDCDGKKTIDGVRDVRIVKGLKLNGVPSDVPQQGLQEPKQTKVRFSRPLEEWIGMDGNTYGPFKAGDVSSLPDSEVAPLIKRSLAERTNAP